MKKIETLVFEPKMIELNPNGHSILEGWNGFVDLDDGCMRGQLPRHIFPDHINQAIDIMKWTVQRLAKNTAHTISKSARLSPKLMPQRSACYGTHQLLTAFGGMKDLEYREGYVLKSSPIQSAHPLSTKDSCGNVIPYKRIEPGTGKPAEVKWVAPGETKRHLQIMYHGWCWDNERQEIVDITEGTYGGCSDGYVVPLAWQTFANNAKRARLALSDAYRKDWNRQQKLYKSHFNYQRRIASRDAKDGMRGKFEFNLPDGVLGSFLWQEPLDIAYTRRAYYHSIHDVLRGFTVDEYMANGIARKSSEMIVNDPYYRVGFVSWLVDRLYKEGSHMRVTAKSEWKSRRKNWREVCDVHYEQDVLDAIDKFQSQNGNEAA